MRKKSPIIVLLFLIGIAACTEETFVQRTITPQAPSDLSYAEVIDAREGKSLKSPIPTVNTYGGEAIFSILGINSATDTSLTYADEFSIIDSTGVIMVASGHSLKGVNTYTADIMVKANDDSTSFTNAFVVTFEKALIEGLTYPLSKETFQRGTDYTSQAPTFAGSTDDVSFALAETEGSSYFTIDSETGAISMDAAATPDIGSIELSVAVNNAADSVIVFDAALTAVVTYKPYVLTYTPAIEADVQETSIRTTQAPVVTATNASGVRYQLVEGTDTAFAIDNITGAVTLKAGHTFTAGTTQQVTVIATSSLGSTTFTDVVAFSIIEQTATAPADFTYLDNGERILMETLAFESAVPTITGSQPMLFSIVEGNTDDQFTVDANNGIIRLAADHTLEAGDYTVKIQAANQYGTTELEYLLGIDPLEKTVFFDGDFTASGAVTGGAVGNMISVDLDNNADESALKLAWYGKTSIWSKIDAKKRAGIQFYPQKAVNEDWVYAEQVDLSSSIGSELFLEWYMLYGANIDEISKYTIEVSEDFNGDITTATWTEVAFLNELFASKDAILSSGSDVTPEYVDQDYIDLSAYDGKVVTVAIKSLHNHELQDGKSTDHLTRALFATEFIISGATEL